MVYRSSRGPGSHGQFQDSARPQNIFRNDGSFLEMFKKMQEQTAGSGEAGTSGEETGTSPPPSNEPTVGKSDVKSPKSDAETVTKPKAPFVGKRRGGRVLPTGLVKRPKTESDEPEEIPKDAWSAYLAEVKRYKETTCEEDGKTRPLVK